MDIHFFLKSDLKMVHWNQQIELKRNWVVCGSQLTFKWWRKKLGSLPKMDKKNEDHRRACSLVHACVFCEWNNIRSLPRKLKTSDSESWVSPWEILLVFYSTDIQSGLYYRPSPQTSKEIQFTKVKFLSFTSINRGTRCPPTKIGIWNVIGY